MICIRCIRWVISVHLTNPWVMYREILLWTVTWDFVVLRHLNRCVTHTGGRLVSEIQVLVQVKINNTNMFCVCLVTMTTSLRRRANGDYQIRFCLISSHGSPSFKPARPLKVANVPRRMGAFHCFLIIFINVIITHYYLLHVSKEFLMSKTKNDKPIYPVIILVPSNFVARRPSEPRTPASATRQKKMNTLSRIQLTDWELDY